jgi:hypothetical protein
MEAGSGLTVTVKLAVGGSSRLKYELPPPAMLGVNNTVPLLLFVILKVEVGPK